MLIRRISFWILIFTVMLSFPAKSDEVISQIGGCALDHSRSLNQSSDLFTGIITYCDGGDATQGEASLQFPASVLGSVDFYSAGYAGNANVTIELRNSAGEAIQIAPARTGEEWIPLNVALPDSWKTDDTLTLVVVDNSGALDGWAGIGYGPHKLLTSPADNYFQFAIRAVIISLAVIVPGIWWSAVSRRRIPLGYVAIPGVMILALLGLAIWVLPLGTSAIVYWAVWIIYPLMLLDLLRTRNRRSAVFSESTAEIKIASLVALLVFLQAIAIGINPLPIAQEINPTSMLPGRMIASPPDHAIPYQTAKYIYQQYDGIEHSKDYFGDWSVTSRGPLVPLGINALFQVFRSDPGSGAPERSFWPLSTKGADIARIYGWLLNSLAVLGAFQLLSSLGVSTSGKRTALVWLALSPVVIINTVFLWPKLLAAYFVLLAVAALIERRRGLAGILTAMAWLSHPVGVLMIPAMGLFAIFLPHTKAMPLFDVVAYFRRGYLFVLALGLTMAPWLIYKSYLGQNDPFMTYLLAGGDGTARAPDVQAWLLTRIDNFWLTLSPGAFFFSKHMHGWLYGPIGDALRWSIQYAKTLPGALGFSCFLFAYVALFSKQTSRELTSVKWWLLIGGFLIMVIFWGFSADGLGRNSLEPISVLLIVFTIASRPQDQRILPFLFPILALEGQWLQWSGFIFDPTFDVAMVKLDAWFCLFASVIISAALVAIGIQGRDQRLMEANTRGNSAGSVA